MSQITSAKLGRQKSEEIISRDKHGRVRFNLDGTPMKKKRVLGYEPPTERRWMQTEYMGYKLRVLVSPGQIINKRKEYIRQAKKFGINPLKISLK